MMNGHQLAALQQKPSVPLDLGDGLVMESILRFLPGKRIVGKCRLDDRTLLVKCFIGDSRERHARREVAGARAFAAADIQTPAIVSSGPNPAGDMQLVSFEYLPEAISFTSLWNEAVDDSQRIEWMIAAVQLLGKLHLAGVCQDDIHLDNLLWSQGKLWMIDGGGADISSYKQNKPLTDVKAKENLARFFAVFFPRYDRLLEQVYPAWCEQTGFLPDPLEQLLERIQRQRKWRERFLEKTLRTCTDFLTEKTASRFFSVRRDQDSEALRHFLDDPDSYFKPEHVIKAGSTNTVAVFALNDGRKVVAKRYLSRKNWLHTMLRTLRTSRAEQSWKSAHLLKMLGIPTAEPLAMLELRTGPLVTCSYVVNEWVPNEQLMNYFGREEGEVLPHDSAEEQKIAEQAAMIIESLGRGLVAHGDLKANNFLVHQADKQVLLVDLDSMKSYKNSAGFAAAREKDLERFNRNWVNNRRVQALFKPLTPTH
ncbi:lipopolysaccharide kinase InaA family protein [Endozoicomonadaceae bacterium StTr2]